MSFEISPVAAQFIGWPRGAETKLSYMKNYLIPFFMVAIATTLLFSCGNDALNLEGRWAAQSVKIESTKYDENMKTLIGGEYAKTNLTFQPEGKVEMVRGQNIYQGVYTLDETTQVLKLGSAEGAPQTWSEEYTIQDQGAQEMTFVTQVDQDGSTATVVFQKQVQ